MFAIRFRTMLVIRYFKESIGYFFGELKRSSGLIRSIQKWRFIISLTTSLAFLGSAAFGSDYRYEKQRSEAIAESIRVGDPVWLKQLERSFLSIFLEAETTGVQGAVLIIPGITEHPDSNGLVRSLRTSFPAKGWTSMTVQMPVRHPGDPFESYLSLVKGSGIRIRSAIDFLITKKVENVVLIGHGLGALMCVDYLKDNKKPGIAAAVFISVPVPGNKSDADALLKTLEKIEVPVLDIYASRDLDIVTQSAGLRRQSMKKNESFRQSVIEGAKHRFQNETDLLFKRVYSWMMVTAPGVQIEKIKQR